MNKELRRIWLMLLVLNILVLLQGIRITLIKNALTP